MRSLLLPLPHGPFLLLLAWLTLSSDAAASLLLLAILPLHLVAQGCLDPGRRGLLFIRCSILLPALCLGSGG